MLRTAVRNVLAHRARLLMSGLAIVLGVAFIAGTLTFTDALNRTFTSLFAETSADVNVEPHTAFSAGMAGTGMSSASASLPASLVDRIGAVDGVAAVAGFVRTDGVYALDGEGGVGDTGGAPGIGVSWTDDPRLSAARVVDGRPPAGPDEVAVDTATAERLGYHVGDAVTVLTPGPRLQARLVGILRFGEDGGLAGASLTAFDTATAQRLLLAPGRFSGIGVAAADGIGDEELAGRVAAALGDRYHVATREEQAADEAASLEDDLAFINTFLLAFAGVALFVGSFLILNTFSMLVAQRTRELALLRALGASRRQVTRSVLVEALVLGTVGATVGLVAGYGLAQALRVLFGRFGFTIDGGLSLSGSTVVWSYAIGVVVSLVAAYLPARRAAAVPPVAAMRADLVTTSRSLRTRTIVGSVTAVAGAGGLAVGIATDAVPAVAAGAGGLVVSAIALSPVLAVPFLRVLGAVLPRVAGTTGRLARENALRDPRRTAATSSALMIGLALVTTFGIIGASARASIDRIVDDVLRSDYVVTSAMGQPFTTEVARQIRRLDGVASATRERYGTARIDGHEALFSAYDAATVGDALDVEMVQGRLAGLGRGTVLVSEKEARATGLAVGDRVKLQVATGASGELRVAGIYADRSGLSPYAVSMADYTRTGGVPLDQSVFVTLEPDADPAALRAAVEDVVAGYPIAHLEDAEGYKEGKRAGVDQLLMLINALLALSVLIAVLGVVNTLVLSVIERTRELGLLRALGMGRRQVRRMVRLESVVISLFGAALGIGLGALLGVALADVLHSQGLVVTSVPWSQLGLGLVLGAVIGVVAAALPARRAARLDVLDAIAVA